MLKKTTKKVSGGIRGFSLIEVLIVIGIIAVLASVVLVAVNPNRQFKLARDSQRTSNVAAILSAIGQNISENRGIFSCEGSAYTLPSSSSVINSSSTSANLAKCLVPNYLSMLPYDPSKTGANYTSTTTYDTGYKVLQDSYGRITVSADGEISSSISATR